MRHREGPEVYENLTEQQIEDAHPQRFPLSLVSEHAETRESLDQAFLITSAQPQIIARDTADTTPDNHSGTSEESNNNVFQCSDCEATFGQRGELNTHTRRKHKLQFKCSMCQWHFGLKTDRDRHMHTHERITALPCEIGGCQKTFTRKDNLQRHARKTHARLGGAQKRRA